MMKEFFGSEAPLAHEPRHMVPDLMGDHFPQEQFFGSNVGQFPVTSTEDGLGVTQLDKQVRSPGSGNIAWGNTASHAPLNHTPQKGWDSHETPMSNRAIAQSKPEKS